LERDWLFSIHHNGELKVWDWNGLLRFRYSQPTMGFLIDASTYVYNIYTVLVASIAYSCNCSWLWIVKYNSLQNEFHSSGEFKLELPGIPSCVRFDAIGQLWFSFLNEDLGIRKVVIDYKELLFNIQESRNISTLDEKNNLFQFDSKCIPMHMLTTNGTPNKLWNRPQMLYEMRKKQYVLDWKGKKHRTNYNL
jgi:hypothetical protein